MSTKPPYTITSNILRKIEEIGREVGILEVTSLQQVSVKLRKESAIRTIYSSLAIEGNTLSLDQVRSIFEGKLIVGPSKDIKEIQNATEVYRDLKVWDGLSEDAFLKAYRLLMGGLVPDNGKWRKGGVAIYKGDTVTRMAPPADRVPMLMDNLFNFINTDDAPWLIKACVFHYELEFIHPFSDGNGRMGRLWQQILLMRDQPIFEYVYVEEIIRRYQEEYYDILRVCDIAADSTRFIEFSLDKILMALKETPRNKAPLIGVEDRIEAAKSKFNKESFSRKQYAQIFAISSATASRDLLHGVKTGILSKTGDKALTKYSYQK